MRADLCKSLEAGGGRDEGTDCLFDVPQGEVEHRHVLLTGDRGDRQAQVVVCGHFAVARHVPRASQDDVAGQRISDTVNVLRREGKRVLIHADLRVREIAIVEEDHV